MWLFDNANHKKVIQCPRIRHSLLLYNSLTKPSFNVFLAESMKTIIFIKRIIIVQDIKDNCNKMRAMKRLKKRKLI